MSVEWGSQNPLHQEKFLLLCDRNQLVQLLQHEGERLLAQYVFAQIEGVLGVLVVVGVRGTDVDFIDVLL